MLFVYRVAPYSRSFQNSAAISNQTLRGLFCDWSSGLFSFVISSNNLICSSLASVANMFLGYFKSSSSKVFSIVFLFSAFALFYRLFILAKLYLGNSQKGKQEKTSESLLETISDIFSDTILWYSYNASYNIFNFLSSNLSMTFLPFLQSNSLYAHRLPNTKKSSPKLFYSDPGVDTWDSRVFLFFYKASLTRSCYSLKRHSI